MAEEQAVGKLTEEEMKTWKVLWGKEPMQKAGDTTRGDRAKFWEAVAKRLNFEIKSRADREYYIKDGAVYKQKSYYED